MLEINPLPSLAKNDVFNLFPQTMGLTYNDIVKQIVYYGLKRNGLADGETPALSEILAPMTSSTH